MGISKSTINSATKYLWLEILYFVNLDWWVDELCVHVFLAIFGGCHFMFIFIEHLSPDKPPIEELQYFLEFQVQRVWAPAPVNIPGHQRKEPVCPSLQFSLMGPKLYISAEQVMGYRFFIVFYKQILRNLSCISRMRIMNPT